MASKKDKRAERRSTAAATRQRREKVKRGIEPQTFKVPDGVELFQLKKEKESPKINIIPYTVGKGNPMADEGTFYWERTFYVHRNVGPNQKWFICPARTVNKPCPVCEYVAKLQKDPNGDLDVIKALIPSKRQLFNVEDLRDPGKIKLWDISYFFFGKQLDAALDNEFEDDNDNKDNFADAEGGYYLKLGVEENSYEGKKSYKVADITFKARKEDIDEDLLEKAICLDDILIIPSYEEIKAAMAGSDDDDDKDEKKSSKL